MFIKTDEECALYLKEHECWDKLLEQEKKGNAQFSLVAYSDVIRPHDSEKLRC